MGSSGNEGVEAEDGWWEQCGEKKAEVREELESFRSTGGPSPSTLKLSLRYLFILSCPVPLLPIGPHSILSRGYPESQQHQQGSHMHLYGRSPFPLFCYIRMLCERNKIKRKQRKESRSQIFLAYSLLIWRERPYGQSYCVSTWLHGSFVFPFFQCGVDTTSLSVSGRRYRVSWSGPPIACPSAASYSLLSFNAKLKKNACHLVGVF